jgi:hypothetical protein
MPRCNQTTNTLAVRPVNEVNHQYHGGYQGVVCTTEATDTTVAASTSTTSRDLTSPSVSGQGQR